MEIKKLYMNINLQSCYLGGWGLFGAFFFFFFLFVTIFLVFETMARRFVSLTMSAISISVSLSLILLPFRLLWGGC